MKIMKKTALLLSIQMALAAAPVVSHAEVSYVNDVESSTAFTGAPYNMPHTTPAENMFYLDNQGFIVLDSDVSDTSSFFIYSDTVYGGACYYGTQKFVPEDGDHGRLCYTLNHAFLDTSLESGAFGGAILPDAISNAIDKNHVWTTEGGAADGGCPETYTFAGGVTLLSLSELKQYASKIGYGDTNYQYLRTGFKNDRTQMLKISALGYVEPTPIANQGGVRPCFWMGKNFFTSTKLDVSKMGASVKLLLTEKYTKAEIAQAGYSDSELLAIGFNDYTESKIAGTTKPGYTLTAQHLKNGTFAWYRCESLTDAGTAISGAIYDTYKLVNADGGKYLKFTVTSGSNVTETIYSAKIDAALSGNFTLGEVNKNWGQPLVTPKQNIFYVGERSYILLDTFDDPDSKFYIYADEIYGNRPYWGGNQTFDPNSADTGRTSTFINHGWLAEGFTTDGWLTMPLPTEIKSNIDYNHVWLTEGGSADGSVPNDYIFTAGVSFLSLAELKQYYAKIGYGAGNYILLRTPSTLAAMNIVCTCTDGVIRHIGINDGNSTVRPAFYLKDNFFKTVKLDIATMGDNVKTAILANYTEDELGIYTKSELRQIGFGKTAAISGTLKPGYTISAGFLSTGGSIAWYRCDTKDAEGTLLSGTATTYTLVNADGGKYIKAVLTTNGSVAETIVSEAIDLPLSNEFDATKALANFPGTTPAENLFVLESDTTAQKFILLDNKSDKDSSFFVYSNESVKGYPFYGTQKFVPTSGDAGILSHVLNHQYLSGTFGDKKIPTDFQSYIDQNHVWLTEGANPSGACPNDYTFTAGISLLSLTELKQYSNKIGSAAGYYVFLRTGYKGSASTMLKTDTNSYIGTLAVASAGQVRPCFWLKEDFFKKVRLDLLNTGSNVKKAIRERYTMSELSEDNGGIYNADELQALGYDAASCNIYHLSYKGDSSTEVTSAFNAGSSLNVSATVASYGQSTPVSMIVAIYDENGNMVRANLSNASLSIGQELPMSVTVDLDDLNVTSGYTAVTYFWNSVKDIIPIGQSYPL